MERHDSPINTFNINFGIMLLVSCVFTYSSVNIMIATGGEPEAYGVGFMCGRAMAGILLPLALVYIPVAFLRREKVKFTKGTYVAWWVLFFLVNVLSLMGSSAHSVS